MAQLLQQWKDVGPSASVTIATDGQVVHFPLQQNLHRDGILAVTEVPAAAVPADVQAAAVAAARQVVQALAYVGVLCIEFFWLDDGRLVVNEMAPRPHNSGHWTLDACGCSQFENHIRAVAGWPLGATARHSDAVMDNLIGEEADNWPALAAEPVRVMSYNIRYGTADDVAAVIGFLASDAAGYVTGQVIGIDGAMVL